jgi:methyl-accepting chemotaxis protein
VHGSNEASANVETVAAAAEELSASIKEISRQLVQANETVHSAAVDATVTNDDIAALARITQRIGDVVNFIQDIAEQTNLLAPTPPSRRRAPVTPAAASPWSLRR